MASPAAVWARKEGFSDAFVDKLDEEGVESLAQLAVLEREELAELGVRRLGDITKFRLLASQLVLGESQGGGQRQQFKAETHWSADQRDRRKVDGDSNSGHPKYSGAASDSVPSTPRALHDSFDNTGSESAEAIVLLDDDVISDQRVLLSSSLSSSTSSLSSESFEPGRRARSVARRPSRNCSVSFAAGDNSDTGSSTLSEDLDLIASDTEIQEFFESARASLESCRAKQVAILDSLEIREAGTDHSSRKKRLKQQLIQNGEVMSRAKFDLLKMSAADWLLRLGELRAAYKGNMRATNLSSTKGAGFMLVDSAASCDEAKIAELVDLVSFKPFVSVHIEASAASSGSGLEQIVISHVVNRVGISEFIDNSSEERAPTFVQTLRRYVQAVRHSPYSRPELVIDKRLDDASLVALERAIGSHVARHVAPALRSALGSTKVQSRVIVGDELFGGNQFRLCASQPESESLGHMLCCALSCCWIVYYPWKHCRASIHAPKFRTWIQWSLAKPVDDIVAEVAADLGDLCVMPQVPH